VVPVIRIIVMHMALVVKAAMPVMIVIIIPLLPIARIIDVHLWTRQTPLPTL
jgi:hypothetical protein